MTVITLGVRDVAASRKFYVEGLQWPTFFDVVDEVVFIRIGYGHLMLALYGADDLAAEAGRIGHAADGLAPPISLAHNVDSADQVARVLEQATVAGATLIAPAQQREWGGVSGYFADPDGFRWEVAHNPFWTIGDDGIIRRAAEADSPPE
ncbi:MAG: VOC family protein [Nocardioidaceae bacterium]